MGFKARLLKFLKIALQEAPLVMEASGVDPELATKIGHYAAIGVTAAQAMPGADNTAKALEAETIATATLQATNDILVSRGHEPLVDIDAARAVMGDAVKGTYDASKLTHLQQAGPLPVPEAAAPAL